MTLCASRINASRIKRAVAISGTLVFLLLSGCGSARLVSSWRDPSLTGPMNFKKIAVLANHPERIARQRVEDEMVRQIGPDRAVAGHTFIKDDERKQIEVVKSRLKEQGFDGAVTLKLAGARSGTAVASDANGPQSFFESYDRNVASFDEPGTTDTINIVSIQTNIYSVGDGKLLWTGTTELYNPTDATKISADIAKAVGDELRKEKLMK